MTTTTTTTTTDSSLDQPIAERKKRLADLDRKEQEIKRERLIVEAELRAYVDAAARVTANRSSNGVPSPSLNSSIESPSSSVSAHAVQRMPESWRIIFMELAKRRPDPLSNDEMRGIITSSGIELNDPNFRQMLYTYNERGWIVRVRQSSYALTDIGMRVVEMLKTASGGLLPMQH